MNLGRRFLGLGSGDARSNRVRYTHSNIFEKLSEYHNLRPSFVHYHITCRIPHRLKEHFKLK